MTIFTHRVSKFSCPTDFAEAETCFLSAAICRPVPEVSSQQHLSFIFSQRFSCCSFCLPANYYDGSDLIVNFGERTRPSEVCGDVPASMKRQVRFFDDVAVHCFQYPSRDEVSTRWYHTLRKTRPSSGNNVKTTFKAFACYCLSRRWKLWKRRFYMSVLDLSHI